MAATPGGISSKLGHTYERRFAVEQLLLLIAGRLRRLRWEPASGERGGADLELERVDGVVEHVQAKRQHGSHARWTVAALQQEGVLAAAARTLARNGTAYTFVSADPVPHLKDISDQLSGCEDPPAVFIESHVRGNKERLKSFQELLRAWDLDGSTPEDQAVAIGRLRSMRWIVLPRDEHGRQQLEQRIEQALTGDPENVHGVLCQFLEDRLACDVLPTQALDYLQQRGILARDLARDPSLPSAIRDLLDSYLAAKRGRLIGGSMISRPEARSILGRIGADEAPRIVLVHGRPGAGKSAVLLGLVEGLIARGVPCLPLSLDANPPVGSPRAYGASLELHASPAAALRAVASSSRAVLVVDQLDALRLTSSSAAAGWQSCSAVLEGALGDGQTTVVVACRTFDLDHDPNIRKWRDSLERSQAHAMAVIEVGDLALEDVQPVVTSKGVDPSSLPARVRQLLRHPNTLDAWCRLASRGTVLRRFATYTELMNELVTTLVVEAIRLHHAAEAGIDAVLDTATSLMARNGSMVAAASAFDRHCAALKACCEVGLLLRHGRTVSFPHQSYFDHLSARQALREAGCSAETMLEWVKRDQSLERRDPLRHLLFALRDEQPTTAARLAELLLLDVDVRFHLKQIVLGVLREAQGPMEEEVRIVERLAMSDAWADHVGRRLLWRSKEWFDALHRSGAWRRMVRASSGSRRAMWLQAILAMMPHRPGAVDDIIGSVLEEPGGIDLMRTVLSADPSEDSPRIAAVRDSLVKAGTWEVPEFGLARLAGTDPARAVRLVDWTIRGLLRKCLAPSGADVDLEDRLSGSRSFEAEIGVAARAQPALAFDRFSRLLLLCERLRGLCDRDRARPWPSGQSYRLASLADKAATLTVRLLASAIEGLSQTDPAAIERLLATDRANRSVALADAVQRGLGLAGAASSDAALRWLCERRLGLVLDVRQRRDAMLPEARLVRQHAATCSDHVLGLLEARLLAFWPSLERRRYRTQVDLYCKDSRYGVNERGVFLPHVSPVGRLQHTLLSEIPEGRRSAEVRSRLRVWNSKFARPCWRSDRDLPGGMVCSPIPEEREAFVSDRQWLRIARRQWGDRRWRQLGPGRLAESSHSSFAGSFGRAAGADAARFVRLALRLPRDAPPIYIARLWDGLSQRGALLGGCSVPDLDALMAATAGTGDGDAIGSACRVIETHPNLEWGRGAVLLLETATTHPDPAPDEGPARAGAGAAANLEGTALNCTRGLAARAMSALAWNNAARRAMIEPMVRRLARDPHPAVRAAAAQAALAVFTTSQGRGAVLLQRIAEHADDRVLASSNVNRLLGHARWRFPSYFHPLLGRMCASSHPETARLGARWVTAEHVQRGTCGEDYRRCRNGTPDHRAAVAGTLAELVLHELETAGRAADEIAPLFDDQSAEVRAQAATVFMHEGVLLHERGVRLAARFVHSLAFEDEPGALLRPLAREPVELDRVAECVLVAADRFGRQVATGALVRRERASLHAADVCSLLVRLHDRACKIGSRALATECLDRWDHLLASGIDEADRHLDAVVG